LFFVESVKDILISSLSKDSLFEEILDILFVGILYLLDSSLKIKILDFGFHLLAWH